MNLKEVFTYLESISLHEPLHLWFNKSYNEGFRGKVISYNLMRELFLNKWNNENFGLSFIKDFSAFLNLNSYTNPINICEAFAVQYIETKKSKKLSLNIGNLFNVKNEKFSRVMPWGFFLEAIGIEYGRDCSSPNDLIIPINYILKRKKIKISDISKWFTIYDEGLQNISDGRTACDKLGITAFVVGKHYVVLDIVDKCTPYRPTIIDGHFALQFRPEHETRGNGRTLPIVSLQPKEGLPEIIIEEKEEHYIEFKKILDFSNNELKQANDVSWENYLSKEITLFETGNSEMREAIFYLNCAWGMNVKTEWWR